MRLLVVRFSLPDSTLLPLLSKRMAAQPPVPGFPLQAPSVYMSMLLLSVMGSGPTIKLASPRFRIP